MDIEYKRWIARNNAQYGTEDNTTSLLLRNQTLTKIKDMYLHKETLLSQDQHIFQRPIDQWESKTIPEILLWIRTHEDHIKVCRQLAATHHKLNSSDIRRFGIIHSTPETVPINRRNAGNSISRVNLHQSKIAPLTMKAVGVNEDFKDLMPSNGTPTKLQTLLSKFWTRRQSQRRPEPMQTVGIVDSRQYTQKSKWYRNQQYGQSSRCLSSADEINKISLATGKTYEPMGSSIIRSLDS